MRVYSGKGDGGPFRSLSALLSGLLFFTPQLWCPLENWALVFKHFLSSLLCESSADVSIYVCLTAWSNFLPVFWFSWNTSLLNLLVLGLKLAFRIPQLGCEGISERFHAWMLDLLLYVSEKLGPASVQQPLFEDLIWTDMLWENCKRHWKKSTKKQGSRQLLPALLCQSHWIERLPSRPGHQVCWSSI